MRSLNRFLAALWLAVAAFSAVSATPVAAGQFTPTYEASAGSLSPLIEPAAFTGPRRALLSGNRNPFTLALNADFTTGTAPSSLVYSRSSQATMVDASGNVVYGPNNVQPYSEDVTQASAYTNTAVSVANGPAPPTGYGTASQTLTADGTASTHSNAGFLIYTQGASYIFSRVVKAGTASFVQLLLGSGSFGTTTYANFDLSGGVTGTIGSSATAGIINLGGGWYRVWMRATATASASSITTGLYIVSSATAARAESNSLTGSVSVAAAQVEQVTAAQTTPSAYLKTTTSPAYGPRFTYVNGSPAFLPEGATTNSIRNSTMQGAVVGSPGTIPTNWTVIQGNGVSVSVAGTGASGGIPYVDLLIAGTPTTTSSVVVQFDGNTTVSGAQNQVWTGSFYASIAAGSLTNLRDVAIGISEKNNTGSQVAYGQVNFTPSGTVSRSTYTRTLNQATTAFLVSTLAVDYSSGLAFSITLRIGLPQLEQQASATTPVPTFGTALTRAAEVAYLDVSNLGLSSAGYTVVQKGYMPPAPANTNVLLYAQGGGNPALNVYTTGTTGTFSATDASGSTTATNIGTGLAAGSYYAYAMRVRSGEVAGSVNGSAIGKTTGLGTPRAIDRIYLGYYGANGTAYSNAPISSVSAYRGIANDNQLMRLAQ